MKKVFAMIVLTILFFLLSFDVLFQTNIFLDITLVILYLLLVSHLSLDLSTHISLEKELYILTEKKTSLFAPMILMPFLGMSYSFGTVFFLINILVIVLLYGYVFLSLKRNSITITKDEVSVVYLNNNKDSMLFVDVDKVEFNWVYNYIGLSTKNGKKIILDITLKDFVIVIRAIKKNVNPKVSIQAFRRLSNYYKAFLVTGNIKYLE